MTRFVKFVKQDSAENCDVKRQEGAVLWSALCLGLFSSPLSVVLPSNGNHLFLAVMGVIFAQPSSSQDGRCASLNLASAAARTERGARPEHTAWITAVIVEPIVVLC